MATVTTCVYRSVTLQEGERYVIPSGGEIIYVSNSGNITSECADIPETDTTCYTFYLTTLDDYYYNAEDFRGTAFKLNDITITLNSSYGTGDGTKITGSLGEAAEDFVDRLAANIWDQLSSITNGALILGLKVEQDTGSQEQLFLSIQVPNIFTDVKFEVKDLDSNDGTNNPTFYFNGTLNGDCSDWDGGEDVERSYKGSLD